MKLKRFIKIFLCLVIGWFLIHSACIIADGLQDEGKTADAAVILGTTVNEDGTLSERLRQRVACGLELYKAGRVKYIIVSGGLGKEGFYEGDKMKEYLVQDGVPANRIVTDNQGYNTRDTAKNVRKLKDSLKLKSLIAVSQYFHVTRTKMLLRKQGFKDVSNVSPRFFEFRDLFSIVREFPAYYTQ
ncbi:YdcF family protein [Flavobacterium album]|uniref:YdcF family protein n=1 Tax=Flavobacterium album TaxID=2175091 RepID=A0A2S1QUQ8_9FLAO|nr:YdcF family protein [Flavobacterium album]AWH84124.1 YdcF family protein [Flavobacterium album]